jgi:MerR family redox-sensitive transcriptional activator SoxR
MPEATLSIGEVASMAGLSVSAIRFYERKGLLPEADRVAGQRRFSEEAIERLRIIGVAKQAGLSLPEIGSLLTAIDEGIPAHEQLRAIAARGLPQIDAAIERARATREWLLAASWCDCEMLDECALFAPGREQPQPRSHR